jgi:hypothetical protein
MTTKDQRIANFIAGIAAEANPTAVGIAFAQAERDDERQREATAATILAALVGAGGWADSLTVEARSRRVVAYAVALADELRAELSKPVKP